MTSKRSNLIDSVLGEYASHPREDIAFHARLVAQRAGIENWVSLADAATYRLIARDF